MKNQKAVPSELWESIHKEQYWDSKVTI